MDSMAKVMVVVAAGATVVTVAKIVADAIVRYAETQRRELGFGSSAIEERLDRIEIAVDAIAIEVERAGELQRFTAQLTHPSEKPLPPRVVTPH